MSDEPKITLFLFPALLEFFVVSIVIVGFLWKEREGWVKYVKLFTLYKSVLYLRVTD